MHMPDERYVMPKCPTCGKPLVPMDEHRCDPDDVRAHTIEECAKVCELEAAACRHHAEALRRTRPKARITAAQAHEMTGQQSAACAHYIRLLKEKRP